MSKQIVIANCGGFWGDDPTAAARQVRVDLSTIWLWITWLK